MSYDSNNYCSTVNAVIHNQIALNVKETKRKDLGIVLK